MFETPMSVYTPQSWNSFNWSNADNVPSTPPIWLPLDPSRVLPSMAIQGWKDKSLGGPAVGPSSFIAKARS